MQNYTSATIEGFVTHDPVLKTTKTGKQVCSFSVAVNHYSLPDAPPRVSYIDIETWEKVAEICSQRVSKGKKVMIMGTLKQDRWDGKDGKTQSKIKLIGNQIRFLDTSHRPKDSEETEDETVTVVEVTS